jgi:hypothetical protein
MTLILPWHSRLRVHWSGLLLSLLLLAAAPAFAEEDNWWWIRGFQFTPGVGLRHLGLDVVRRSDNFKGNISTDIAGSAFAALSIESPSYRFGNSNFGISVYAYAANVNLNSQWVADGTQNTSTGTENGSRQNVGTGVSGYYSYLVPALHYSAKMPSGGEAIFALGYGKWIGRFSGNVILTADDRPAAGMPKTAIDVNVTKNAYLFLMQYKFANHWQAYMSVGGPKWQDGANRYELEEVSLVVGYTFTL